MAAGMAVGQTIVECAVAQRQSARLHRAADTLDKALTDEDYPTPPERGVVMGDPAFRAVGIEFLAHFIELGGLEPDHDVLDIGCGGGRMAAALLYYLEHGSYLGFDVHEDSIAWCRSVIESRHPRFSFEFVDIDNPIYNRSDQSAKDFVFPYASEAYDFAVATSVFTHMFLDEVANYLHQTFRALRPGGAFFCTAFLLTPSALVEMARNQSSVKFPFEQLGSLINDRDRPTGAVAHFPEAFFTLATIAGFIPERLISGLWTGNGAGVTKQDIVVLRKVDRLASMPSG
jgi:SAM-dependent methyltransferase